LRNVLLVILDGWGHSEKYEGNAIIQAHTPNMDCFSSKYPFALIDAAGEAVGLPPGQMGNSEVGHLNLGAGRIVYQELTRISQAIKTGEFYHNEVINKAIDQAKERGKSLHLVGLVSDGGVHSHYDHLLALLDLAEKRELNRVYIHAILDGRDTAPRSAGPFLEKLEKRSTLRNNGFIATVSGRYYAMDRDKRWERTRKAYLAYAAGQGHTAVSPMEALRKAYGRSESDEFMQPTVIVGQDQKPLAVIGSEDSIIFFNFRPDRMRQLFCSFIDNSFTEFDRGDFPPRPYTVSMTEYYRNQDAPVAFSQEDLVNTIGEVYSSLGLFQARAAETEKYAHVTFFFSGGREKPFPGEDRILVPSPRLATYDLQPEMSAYELTDRVTDIIRNEHYHLVIVNFANPDMVAHTGNLEAAKLAIEAVDKCVGEIVAAALAAGWFTVIGSDHGNAEKMLSKDGNIVTAHSANKVPFIFVGPDKIRIRAEGILADIAPTILEIAGLEIPVEMTGKSMIVMKD